MMITFTFTTTFSVLGALALGRFTHYTNEKTVRLDFGRPDIDVSAGAVAFAAMLTILFLLNTGAASTLALGGSSPSNVPWAEAQDSTQLIDTSGHVWVNDHAYGKVYGDITTNGQTDWYLPSIELKTMRDQAYGTGIGKPRGDILSLRDSPDTPGYVLLTTHNIEDREIDQPFSAEPVSLSELDHVLTSRNKIYSTSQTAVYYEPSDE